MMTEDNSLCMSCRYQTGNWVFEREMDTWCVVKKGIDCDEVFECDDYKSEDVIPKIKLLRTELFGENYE